MAVGTLDKFVVEFSWPSQLLKQLKTFVLVKSGSWIAYRQPVGNVVYRQPAGPPSRRDREGR